MVEWVVVMVVDAWVVAAAVESCRSVLVTGSAVQKVVDITTLQRTWAAFVAVRAVLVLPLLQIPVTLLQWILLLTTAWVLALWQVLLDQDHSQQQLVGSDLLVDTEANTLLGRQARTLFPLALGAQLVHTHHLTPTSVDLPVAAHTLLDLSTAVQPRQRSNLPAMAQLLQDLVLIIFTLTKVKVILSLSYPLVWVTWTWGAVMLVKTGGLRS
jgi:hypothetical protein